MPESPEVQALAEFLDARLSGRVVTGTGLEEFRALKTRDRPLDGLVGQTVASVSRRGKHLDVALDTDHLVISFGRAGWAMWTEPGSAEPDGGAPVIARLAFDDGGALAVTDAGGWLSLGLSVVDDADEVPTIARLGPDAAELSEPEFAALLGRRKQLRALLQEQEALAGIGGAYSDEILHVARLSPVVHAADLDAAERARLYAALTEVLGGAFAARRGVPIERQKAEKVAAMRVHGRTGEACPVCGTTVHDIPGTKGGGQYCPGCQTGGAPLG